MVHFCFESRSFVFFIDKIILIDVSRETMEFMKLYDLDIFFEKIKEKKICGVFKLSMIN